MLDVSLAAETDAYNIVQARERFLAIAKSLGPLSLFHERLGERDLGTLVMSAASLDEAKARALQGESAAAMHAGSTAAGR